MTQLRQLLQTSVLALAATAPAAFADVTAQDVWDQWKAYLSQSGQTLSVGSEQMTGDTLTVSDIQIAMDMPDAGMNGTISSIVFKENGDGTVSVTMPPEYPLSLNVKPEGEPGGTMNMVVRQTDMTLVASGSPENTVYAMAGKEIAVVVDSFEMEGEDKVDMAVEFRMGGIAGSYNVMTGDMMTFTSSMNAATMNVDVNASDPAGSGKMTMNVSAQNITASSNGSLPEMMDYSDLGAMMAAGFMVDGNMSYGASEFSFDFSENSDGMSASGSADSGGVVFKMSPDGMSYTTSATGMDMSISGSDIPLPEIALQMAESAFGLTMPMSKTDEPKDIGILIRMVGLSVGEDIWGMIDPGGALPHDPATLIVDLGGKAKWLVDITAPDAEQQMAEAAMPGEVHALDINELKLSIAGAELTGTGQFTFDNADMMTWGGVPAPDGAVDLKLSGANGLMDKLVAMGLLPQDQVMQARMMLGMFARPGDGPDTMVSTIEVKKEGSVFANGMQLK